MNDEILIELGEVSEETKGICGFETENGQPDQKECS
jgi:hypothetical protein